MSQNLSRNDSLDTELVLAIRSGDDKAYEKLMNRYDDTVYFMILKMVTHKVLAKELTMEAFEKAYLNIQQFEPQFAFSSWLFRIAYNNTIDYLRRKKVTNRFFMNPFEDVKKSNLSCQESLLSDEDDPEQMMIKYENAIILRKVVSDLKPRYRRLLEMRYFREYSYAEIAMELNLPVGTIKVQLFRSRKLLFESLKNSPFSYS